MRHKAVGLRGKMVAPAPFSPTSSPEPLLPRTLARSPRATAHLIPGADAPLLPGAAAPLLTGGCRVGAAPPQAPTLRAATACSGGVTSSSRSRRPSSSRRLQRRYRPTRSSRKAPQGTSPPPLHPLRPAPRHRPRPLRRPLGIHSAPVTTSSPTSEVQALTRPL
jgi:hypothetical protein